jgi:hypothetical protein
MEWRGLKTLNHASQRMLPSPPYLSLIPPLPKVKGNILKIART